jgi:hypothetical protein
MLGCFPVRRWGVGVLATLALLFATGGVHAQDCYRQDCYQCQRTHCPPCYKHCQEGAPRIKFQCGCPQPICNPCYSPNWGYFETCWTPNPWRIDYSHCAVPPPAALVNTAPGALINIAPPAGLNTIPGNPLPPLQESTGPIHRLPNPEEPMVPRPLNRPGL